MANKRVKSNLLSAGIISAISATGILLGGVAANAQTDSTNLNQSPSQTNQSPTQLNNQSPAPVDPSQTQPSQSQTQPSQLPTEPSQNNAAPSTSTTPSTSNTSGSIGQYSPNQAPILRVGSQGQAVRDLQAFLNQQGIYPAAPDGVYGQQTRAAVAQFQQSRNLPADGIVGPQTWGAMLNGLSGSSSSGTSGQPQ